MILNQEFLKEFARLGIGTSLFQLSAPASWDLGLEPNQWQCSEHVPKLKNTDSVWMTLNHYIPTLARMGFKKLRISVEWNHVEPVQGRYSYAAILQYLQVIEKCLCYDIEPMVTLHHFTQPAWFSERGGFENAANISVFVDYCRYVLQFIGPYVKFWCTINEPAIESFLGYFFGLFPPHHKIQLHKAAVVLKNLLLAHVEVCQEIEKLSLGAQYSLVHNFLEFESSSFCIQQGFAKPLTHFTNELVMEFMHSGHFDYQDIHYQDSRHRGNCCFVNIYGKVQLGYLGTTCQKNQKMGDMHMALYPESYARALSCCAGLNLPVYVTETGFADRSDQLRLEFILDFFTTVVEQLSQGLDIRGIYYWTFKDNYEWFNGHHQEFGLFSLDDTPKNSAYLLTWLAHNFQKIAAEHREPEIILAEWMKLLQFSRDKINQEHVSFFKNFAINFGVRSE